MSEQLNISEQLHELQAEETNHSPWRKPAITTAVFLVIFLVPASFAPETIISTLTKFAIMALFAISLNMQLGFADMPALGQVMYFGGGAYVFTLLTTRAGIGMLPSFFITIIAFCIVAMGVGFICLRSGTLFGFIFLNFGISLLVWSFINKWMWIGADGGLLNTPRPAFADSIAGFHIFAVIIITVSVILLYLLRISPFMTIIEGSRWNNNRLLFLGVNTRRAKWLMHIYSVIFTVIAGMLFAMRNKGAYPSYLNSLLGTEIIIGLIIGGKNNFLGPLIGAIIVTAVNTTISNVTIYYQGILGVIILLSVYFLRGGIMPGLQKYRKNLDSFIKKKISSRQSTTEEK